MLSLSPSLMVGVHRHFSRRILSSCASYNLRGRSLSSASYMTSDGVDEVQNDYQAKQMLADLEAECASVRRVAGHAAAAKLTGAGGGGCAVVVFRPGLDPDQRSAVAESIKAALATDLPYQRLSFFSSSVGGDGVLWIDPKDFPSTCSSSSSSSSSAASTATCITGRWTNVLLAASLAVAFAGIVRLGPRRSKR